MNIFKNTDLYESALKLYNYCFEQIYSTFKIVYNHLNLIIVLMITIMSKELRLKSNIF